MTMCTCPVKGDSRLVLLEIGDYGRVITARCPDCELWVLDLNQIDHLHGEDVLVAMTRVEPEDDELTGYWHIETPPVEPLEGAE